MTTEHLARRNGGQGHEDIERTREMKSKNIDEYGSNANLIANMDKSEDITEDRQALKSAPLTPQVGTTTAAGLPEPPEDRVLTPDEKAFLLCVERGDTATAKGVIEAMSKRPQIFDINCVDPLGRSALIIAVENENLDMIEMLITQNIKPKDALLVAIREDYVDGVEFLLKHEEDSHVEGQSYSWESMDNSTANFTADVTPLILAAHR